MLFLEHTDEVFESVRTPKRLLAPGTNKPTNSKKSKRILKTNVEKEFKRRKPKKRKMNPLTKEDTIEDHELTDNVDRKYLKNKNAKNGELDREQVESDFLASSKYDLNPYLKD